MQAHLRTRQPATWTEDLRATPAAQTMHLPTSAHRVDNGFKRLQRKCDVLELVVAHHAVPLISCVAGASSVERSRAGQLRINCQSRPQGETLGVLQSLSRPCNMCAKHPGEPGMTANQLAGALASRESMPGSVPACSTQAQRLLARYPSSKMHGTPTEKVIHMQSRHRAGVTAPCMCMSSWRTHPAHLPFP